MGIIDGETMISKVYDTSEWVGEMAIAASPIFFFVGMVMATVSTLVHGSIATSVYFEIPWAVIQAICIDGLWLGVWLRLRSAKVTSWGTGFKYAAILFVAILMFLVGAVMSILLTYQEVNGVSDVLVAMGSLHIDGNTFIVARGVLVMLCATMAIPFRDQKHMHTSVPVPAKKSTPSSKQVQKGTQPAIPPVTPSTTVTQVVEAEESTDMPALESPKSTVGYAESIRITIEKYTQTGQSYTYETISRETGASIPTVKKWAPKIKKELGL